MKRIFTKQDVGRIHAASATIHTFGGGAWLALALASMYDVPGISLGDFGNLGLNVLFTSIWGLIATGAAYTPQSKHYEHYRRTMVATGAIMAADAMLWYWYSHAPGHDMGPLFLPATCIAYALAIMGECQFFLNDSNNRQEAFHTNMIDDGIAAPHWRFLAIAPVHGGTAFLKTVGLYHLLDGGAPWIAEHPHAAAFGGGLFMSNLILAAWSAFTQGTMALRRAPAFGKEVYRLENDLITWSVFAAVSVPLIITGLVGCDTGSLQEYFTL